VSDYGAVGAFVRPNYVNGRYWHSAYWHPLYGLLKDLNAPLCFHEGTGSYYSTIEPRFGEIRFMRHVASHSTGMQLALIALILGGILEFYPRLKVAFLEAQSWWVPGLLAGSSGILGNIARPTRPTFRHWSTGSAIASRRSKAANARSARSSNSSAGRTTSACRLISHISTRASPKCRRGCLTTRESRAKLPARFCSEALASTVSPRPTSKKPIPPPSAGTIGTRLGLKSDSARRREPPSPVRI
jgi:hypothetical protein